MTVDVRNLAAIDIGTNSIHMVVVKVRTDLPSFSITESEKETVRLGERCAQTGNLTEPAMARSIDALKRFRTIAESLGVAEIITVATSATREAPNGSAFLQRVYEEVGLEVELIAGQEEARLIYLGVLSAMELNNQPHIVIDIGGGSTELILGDGHDPEYLSSSKIGAVRLTDLFVKTDPISAIEYDRLASYVQGILERPIDEIRQILGAAPLRLIGTSGTIETIATLHAKDIDGNVPSQLQGYEVAFADIENLVWRLRKANLAERTEMVRQKRAEIILAGGVILQEAMRLLGASRLVVCQRSLREGLIVNWMIRHGYIQDRWRYQSSVRARSVQKLVDKYQINLNYAKEVARHTLSIFDQTAGILHQWGDTERELLWAAAMLHNAGHHISHDAHHKHSYYLIRNGELLGFNNSEIEIIANIARYHRKNEPKRRHENYQRLTTEKQRLFVRQASTFLRLGTALDRRQINAIARVNVQIDAANRRCHLALSAKNSNDPCHLELWSLDYKKAPFEGQFDLALTTALALQ